MVRTGRRGSERGEDRTLAYGATFTASMDDIDAEWLDINICIQPHGPATWEDWYDLGYPDDRLPRR